jgi:hypothetical protein
MIASARWAALLAASVLVAATPAAAQQPVRGSSDVAYDEARKRFDEGKRLIREGKREGNPAKLEMAYVEFKEAYALYPHAKASLLNLVESEIVTGRLVEGMKHLRQFVREHGTPDEVSEYAKAFRQHWDSAFSATGHIEVDAPTGVRVLVDKEEIGFAPLPTPADVSPGHHTIEAIGPQSLRAEINAPAGAIVRTSLEPSAAASPPSSITASATSVPESATTPGPATPVPAPPSRGEADAQTFWTPTSTWSLVTGGAGLVALGVGVVFAVRNKNDAERADALSTQLGPAGCSAMVQGACGDLQRARDDQSTDFAAAVVFLGVGGAAAAIGAVLFFSPKRSHPRAAVLPMLWTQGGGVQLRGELF